MNRHIPLLRDDEVRPDVLQLLREKPPLNVFRLLAYMPEVVRPFFEMISALYRTEFDPRLREVAMCRVGHKAGSLYEFHQHHLLGLKAGVTERELEAIAIDETVTSLDDDGNLVCLAADEIEELATLTPTTYQRVVGRFGAAGAVTLIFICSTYCLVSRTVNASGVQLEASDPLAGRSAPL